MAPESMIVDLWRKGSATLSATLFGKVVLVTPSIGKEFRVSLEDWLIRAARLQSEGWVKDGGGVPSIRPPPVRASSILPRPPSEPPKIVLHNDTVLRRRGGSIYLMTRQEGGWDAYAHRVPSETWVAVKFNVRLGTWARDEHGEYCPVTKMPTRMVSKPPRPGGQKSG